MELLKQQVLCSECPSCSFGRAGLCDGPRNVRTYLMQDEKYTTCLDTAKRERMFADTFKNFPSLPAEGIKSVELPSFIPTVGRSRMEIPDGFAGRTFGVSLGNIIGKRGDLSYQNVDEIKQSFRLPAEARIALIGTSGDQKLENLWKIRETRRIFERIAEMGFDWVTSMTFSVWQEDFPRPDQVKNQWRNYISYDLFMSLGLPCIPFVFPVEDIDWKILGKWLVERPAIDTVAVYARFYHLEDRFKEFYSFMKKVEGLVGRKIRFLVCGIGKGENIARLRDAFECCFENSTMFGKTIHGLSCDPKLKYSRSLLSLEDLFQLNFLQNSAFCSPHEVKPIIYLPKTREITRRTGQPELLGLL